MHPLAEPKIPTQTLVNQIAAPNKIIVLLAVVSLFVSHMNTAFLDGVYGAKL